MEKLKSSNNTLKKEIDYQYEIKTITEKKEKMSIQKNV